MPLSASGILDAYKGSPVIPILGQPLKLSPDVTHPLCFSLQIVAPRDSWAASLSLSPVGARSGLDGWHGSLAFWKVCPVRLHHGGNKIFSPTITFNKHTFRDSQVLMVYGDQLSLPRTKIKAAQPLGQRAQLPPV